MELVNEMLHAIKFLQIQQFRL